MEPKFPQSTYDPLLHQWQGQTPVHETVTQEVPSETILSTPAEVPAVPAPVAQVVETPVHEASPFTVTAKTVTIYHGGGELPNTGLLSTHRIHLDKNGVEHIYWKKVMRPLPTLNVQIVSRTTIRSK